MKKKRKYDLVYVPAESYMLSVVEDNTVKNYIKLKKPINVILLEDMGDKLRVLHDNNTWLIEKKHLRGIYDQT
jgi:hypothetical protein